MKTYCNPLDLGYRYQHIDQNGRRTGFREGADPTLIHFKGRYYLFVSMSAGFWYSDDLLHWEFHADPDLLIYDYAPDVRQIGDFLYFCASRRGRNCPILRTVDPLREPFEEVSAPFAFWDPDLFEDEDGRVYLYWGCSNTAPIYGVEMDPETMTPIGEPEKLVFGQEKALGYERPGENGIVDREASETYRTMKQYYNPETEKLELPPEVEQASGCSAEAMTARFKAVGRPYIEGAFMTKHGGKYYLQYACSGTQFNTYSDGVYVSEKPLGPFTLQESNPFSSKPGGFMTSAGHGSTIADEYGNWWHAATMRISVNHNFERRVGLFPAGFDPDGIRAWYIRVTGGELPYGQALRISGLRVFGNGEGEKPSQAEVVAVRVDALDANVHWKHLENAQGCNVRYGTAPDKLYQSWMVYGTDEVTLSTLIAGQEYYICVDAFNENGITPGKIIRLEA